MNPTFAQGLQINPYHRKINPKMVAKCKLFAYQVHIFKHNMSKIRQLMES